MRACISFVLAVLLPTVLHAQSVVYVSDASGTNSGTCGTSGSPCATIQYAVDNIAVNGDTVLIDTGVYALPSSTSPFTPVVNIPQNKSLSFIGTTAGDGTRIDGLQDRRGFQYYYTGANCNTATASNNPADTLHLYFKDLIIQNCHTREYCGSTTVAYGGGIRVDADTGSRTFVWVKDCEFLNNRSFDPNSSYSGGRSSSGGAIWVWGRRRVGVNLQADRAEVYIDGCFFEDNHAIQGSNGGHGGAILLRDLDTASVTRSAFCSNYCYSSGADNGDLQHDRNAAGAICVYETTAASAPGHGYHVRNCAFINNSATVAGSYFYTSEGGAIFLTKGDGLTATTSARLHIDSCDFYGNYTEAGIEHVDKNGGVLDTTSIGNNHYHNSLELNLGPDTNICVGDTFYLDATTTGATYEWQDGSTGALMEITQPDTYSVTVSVSNCQLIDTVIVTIHSVPNIDLGLDTALCSYDSLLLNATTDSATYTWSTGSTDSVLWASASTVYWVEVNVFGCIGSDTIELDSYQIEPVDLGPDTLYCDTSGILLDATQAGATYLWPDSSTSATFLADSTGSYSVTVTNGLCSVYDTVQLWLVPNPTVDLGPDDTICAGDTLVLQSGFAGGNLWNTGTTADSLFVLWPGQFWVQVDSGGCIGSDTIQVDTVLINAFSLGPDTQLCEDQSITYNVAQGGATYLWQDSSTSSTMLADQAGNYAVTVSKAGCAYEDDANISIQAYPVVNLGEDDTICPYDNVVLDATYAGATYAWNTGAVTPSITVSDEGVYIVAVSIGGCYTLDTIAIDTVEIPPNILGPNKLLCPGDTFALDATVANASSYLWQDGSVQSTYTGSATGLYLVTVYKADCEVSDNIHVAFVEQPVDLIGSGESICQGDTVMLNIWPSGVGNYQWNTGSTQQSIAVHSAGVYWASVIKEGCPFSDTVEVEVRPLPVIDLGEDREACLGDTIVLDATNINGSYTWQNYSKDPTQNVLQTGVYGVTVDVNGCKNESSVKITFKPNPEPDLLTDQGICEGQSHTFNAYHASFDTYLWSNGSTDSAVTFHTAGDHWVAVWMDGCRGADTVHLNVTPVPEIDLGPDTIFCFGDTPPVLDATVAGNAVYLWHDQSNTPTYEVWRAGMHAVRVTRNGCSSTDSVDINVRHYPKLDLPNDTTICLGDSLRLEVFDTLSTFIWNGVQEKMHHTLYDSAYVWVEATNDCGALRDSLFVAFRDCECFFYVPSAFSPDQNGFNELFQPKFECDLYDYRLRIFDRWGELIFETTNPYAAWDGTYRNQALQVGVYVWEVQYDAQMRNNGSRVHFYNLGKVTLLR